MDKAGDILKSFLSFYHLDRGEAYVSFFSRWREIVGDDLASHARTVDIKKGALVVEVDHPGWMQLLQIKQAEILKTIERRYPDLRIRYIHMRLVKEGSGFFSDPAIEEESESEASPSAPETAAPAARTEDIENIQDEELKKILLKLGRSIEEKNRKRRKSSGIPRIDTT